MEPESGIEPASSDYETKALPLSYTGINARQQLLAGSLAEAPGVLLVVGKNARKHSTWADRRHNRRKPTISGCLCSHCRGCRFHGMIHGELPCRPNGRLSHSCMAHRGRQGLFDRPMRTPSERSMIVACRCSLALPATATLTRTWTAGSQGVVAERIWGSSGLQMPGARSGSARTT